MERRSLMTAACTNSLPGGARMHGSFGGGGGCGDAPPTAEVVSEALVNGF